MASIGSINDCCPCPIRHSVCGTRTNAYTDTWTYSASSSNGNTYGYEHTQSNADGNSLSHTDHTAYSHSTVPCVR